MQSLKVDKTKLYTQSKYAEEIGVSRARVGQMIKEKKLKIVIINGATLILKD